MSRKQHYRDDYGRIFDDNGITKSRNGSEYAFCSFCKFDINIGNMGKTAIAVHIKKDKHIRAELVNFYTCLCLLKS
jgi:hypothetical protein